MNFQQLRFKLNESKQLRNETIPAPMLILRRRGMRIFPDGRRIALYTNDKYNLIFTIPYGGNSRSNSEVEAPIVGQPANG